MSRQMALELAHMGDISNDDDGLTLSLSDEEDTMDIELTLSGDEQGERDLAAWEAQGMEMKSEQLDDSYVSDAETRRQAFVSGGGGGGGGEGGHFMSNFDLLRRMQARAEARTKRARCILGTKIGLLLAAVLIVLAYGAQTAQVLHVNDQTGSATSSGKVVAAGASLTPRRLTARTFVELTSDELDLLEGLEMYLEHGDVVFVRVSQAVKHLDEVRVLSFDGDVVAVQVSGEWSFASRALGVSVHGGTADDSLPFDATGVFRDSSA